MLWIRKDTLSARVRQVAVPTEASQVGLLHSARVYADGVENKTGYGTNGTKAIVILIEWQHQTQHDLPLSGSTKHSMIQNDTANTAEKP